MDTYTIHPFWMCDSVCTCSSFGVKVSNAFLSSFKIPSPNFLPRIHLRQFLSCIGRLEEARGDVQMVTSLDDMGRIDWAETLREKICVKPAADLKYLLNQNWIDIGVLPVQEEADGSLLQSCTPAYLNEPMLSEGSSNNSLLTSPLSKRRLHSVT